MYHRCKSFSEQYVELLKRFNQTHGPKIHFPTRRSRLDAAPTELIACFSPVTIKILLLRSIPGPTNVQTPGTGVLVRQIAESGLEKLAKLQPDAQRLFKSS